MIASNCKVLIIDDDKGDRIQIKRALERSNIHCEVTEAQNLKEALNACVSHDFDCAILDNGMPEVKGLEGIPKLFRQMPHMAIVLSSGQGNETIAAESIQGAAEYINKREINAQTISDVIDSALNRKATEQRKALENFSYVLAHDLKEPIRQLKIFCDLLAQFIKTKEYEEIDNIHPFIADSAIRMEALINTLSQYNKSCASEVLFETIALDQVVEDAISNLNAYIEEHNAKILYDDLPSVNGNRPQLIQLMQNLISNAIKYCEDPRPVVEISAHKVSTFYRFTIRDNGIGIPKQYQNEIFKPFKRLHGPSDYSGSGLGLATCRKILERHGGKIWCDSEEGKGSNFYFTLEPPSQEGPYAPTADTIDSFMN